MSSRKTLQELTFKDNFLFAATMLIPENCRMVLERVLERPIERVEVSKEKSIIYHPLYRGVRLDVYARDENNSHYDVEMQIATEKVLKRARYYHSQMDMELLEAGTKYELLPESFVIFICDFDPLGLGKYRYSLRKTLNEDSSFSYDDGVHTVILNTKGKNDNEVSPELIQFLRFVGAKPEESMRDYDDPLVNQLQQSIHEIKRNREMGERYMLFEELLENEYRAGKAEGKAEAILLLLNGHEQVQDSI
ncbi:MAG: Rpn family recombination-promoting nuclease/putative transposase, partial [bacterium]|nr:Rpn family recombination-promoting nuclease/putative transposase [bacterium]